MKHILCLRTTKKKFSGEEFEIEFPSKAEAIAEAVKATAEGLHCRYVLERSNVSIAPTEAFPLITDDETVDLKPMRKKRGPRNKYDRT